MASAAGRYRAALEELTAIRDRLSAAQVPVDDIEELAADAARAMQSARAAVRRTGASIDRLSNVVDGGLPG
jgi:hypothetical protein